MTGTATIADDCRTLSFRVAGMIVASEFRPLPETAKYEIRLLQMDLAALADRIADQAVPVERGRVGWWRRWFRRAYR